MTPETVRKLGRALTRVRLNLPQGVAPSNYLIAKTLAPEFELDPAAIDHWLAGRRKCRGPAAVLLRKLEKESR